MTEMFGEAWPPMSVPDLAPDDDDDDNQLYPVDYTFQVAAIVMYLCDQTESFKLWQLMIERIHTKVTDVVTHDRKNSY